MADATKNCGAKRLPERCSVSRFALKMVHGRGLMLEKALPGPNEGRALLHRAGSHALS